MAEEDVDVQRFDLTVQDTPHPPTPDQRVRLLQQRLGTEGLRIDDLLAIEDPAELNTALSELGYATAMERMSIRRAIGDLHGPKRRFGTFRGCGAASPGRPAGGRAPAVPSAPPVADSDPDEGAASQSCDAPSSRARDPGRRDDGGAPVPEGWSKDGEAGPTASDAASDDARKSTSASSSDQPGAKLRSSCSSEALRAGDSEPACAGRHPQPEDAAPAWHPQRVRAETASPGRLTPVASADGVFSRQPTPGCASVVPPWARSPHVVFRSVARVSPPEGTHTARGAARGEVPPRSPRLPSRFQAPRRAGGSVLVRPSPRGPAGGAFSPPERRVVALAPPIVVARPLVVVVLGASELPGVAHWASTPRHPCCVQRPAGVRL